MTRALLVVFGFSLFVLSEFVNFLSLARRSPLLVLFLLALLSADFAEANVQSCDPERDKTCNCLPPERSDVKIYNVIFGFSVPEDRKVKEIRVAQVRDMCLVEIYTYFFFDPERPNIVIDKLPYRQPPK